MTSLATIDQLEARMAMALNERAMAILEDVSAAVRSYTGQTITAVTDDIIRLRVHGNRVHLPQRPVVDVTAVVDMAANDVSFTWDGIDVVNLWSGLSAFEYDVPATTKVVDVTYSHGYDTVPDDLVSVVCNVAARALSTGAEMAGVTQESITSYSASYGPIGASGPLGFFQAETRILDRYTRPGIVWAS